MMVMQKDGYIVYDSDSSQIGRNVFTDPFYQDYTGLPALTRRTVAERAGVGTYTPPVQPPQKQVVKGRSDYGGPARYGMAADYKLRGRRC